MENDYNHVTMINEIPTLYSYIVSHRPYKIFLGLWWSKMIRLAEYFVTYIYQDRRRNIYMISLSTMFKGRIEQKYAQKVM